jgi:hypothetical protein
MYAILDTVQSAAQEGERSSRSTLALGISTGLAILNRVSAAFLESSFSLFQAIQGRILTVRSSKEMSAVLVRLFFWFARVV